jgi:SAM-dependent methyltransferase
LIALADLVVPGIARLETTGDPRLSYAGATSVGGYGYCGATRLKGPEATRFLGQVQAVPPQREEQVRPNNSDAEWEKFGRRDPYYGVLSRERFRRDNFTPDVAREFFESGVDHVNFILSTIRARIDPDISVDRALDFGCGVGRCSIPLSRISRAVVGVDVSDSMLREAASNCAKQSVNNVQFVKSDDTLSSVTGPFDLVHAFLVLQHVSTRRGERTFSRMVELLSERGVGAIQVVHHRNVSPLVKGLGILRKHVPFFHGFVNLFYEKRFAEPLVEKNVYRLDRLFAILDEQGCGNVSVVLHGGPQLRSALLFFQKGRDKTPFAVVDED